MAKMCLEDHKIYIYFWQTGSSDSCKGQKQYNTNTVVTFPDIVSGPLIYITYLQYIPGNE